MIEPLIPKSEFFGLDDIAHLCAGGESPMLKTHQQAIERFMLDKALGETARHRWEECLEAVRQQCAELLNAKPADITFLSNASEGINNVAYGIEWNAGDNVVFADVEFPSGVLPWTQLEARGVEIRIARHRNWAIELDDIAELIDANTRVVAISHVSMFTGQRIDLAALSKLVRSSNALLLLDATHATGVVQVDASLADVMVSSCYKWLLGTHGAAIFYVNSETTQDFHPPFLGWNSTDRHGGWRNPTNFSLQATSHRFQPGNASFIGLYVLGNALQRLLELGVERIEQHALTLSGQILDAVTDLGFERMTPVEPSQRAGNVCFMVDDLDAMLGELERERVLIWGTYAGFGRLRVSTHVYNDSQDVERCIEALRRSLR